MTAAVTVPPLAMPAPQIAEATCGLLHDLALKHRIEGVEAARLNAVGMVEAGVSFLACHDGQEAASLVLRARLADLETRRRP